VGRQGCVRCIHGQRKKVNFSLAHEIFYFKFVTTLFLMPSMEDAAWLFGLKNRNSVEWNKADVHRMYAVVLACTL